MTPNPMPEQTAILDVPSKLTVGHVRYFIENASLLEWAIVAIVLLAVYKIVHDKFVLNVSWFGAVKNLFKGKPKKKTKARRKK